MAGESSHVRSGGGLPNSAGSCSDGTSFTVSGHVDCVRMEAASDLGLEASELEVQASEGALVPLSRVVADRHDARAT